MKVASVEQLRREICATATRLPRAVKWGVYFLLQGDEIIYVGQSHDMLGRVCNHVDLGQLEFDRVAFIEVMPCRGPSRERVEAYFIKQLRPRANRCSTAQYAKRWFGVSSNDSAPDPEVEEWLATQELIDVHVVVGPSLAEQKLAKIQSKVDKLLKPDGVALAQRTTLAGLVRSAHELSES